MNGCKKAGITLNRKMLSEIAINDAAGFTAIAENSTEEIEIDANDIPEDFMNGELRIYVKFINKNA